jgi:hypothetical protein
MKSTKDVDARADVWALGAVLYELVVGKPAFDGSTMIEILNAIAAARPIPPSEAQPGIPPQLDAVIACCLRTKPEERYPTVADLAVALQPFASPAGAGLAEQAWRIAQEPPPEISEAPFAMLRSEPRPSVLTLITKGSTRATPASVAAYALGGVIGAVIVVVIYSFSASARGPAAEPPPVASIAAPDPAPSNSVAPAVAPPADTGWVVSAPVGTAAPPPSASVQASVPPPRRALSFPMRRHPAPPPQPSPDLGGFGDRK